MASKPPKKAAEVASEEKKKGYGALSCDEEADFKVTDTYLEICRCQGVVPCHRIPAPRQRLTNGAEKGVLHPHRWVHLTRESAKCAVLLHGLPSSSLTA